MQVGAPPLEGAGKQRRTLNRHPIGGGHRIRFVVVRIAGKGDAFTVDFMDCAFTSKRSAKSASSCRTRRNRTSLDANDRNDRSSCTAPATRRRKPNERAPAGISPLTSRINRFWNSHCAVPWPKRERPSVRHVQTFTSIL